MITIMNNKIFFIIFISVWTILAICNILEPKVKFSEEENRYLARVPSFSLESLIDGKYALGMEEYLNDHFVFRNAWIKTKTKVEQLLGKTEIDNIYIGKNNYLFEKPNYNTENLQIAKNKIEEFAQKVSVPVYFMLVPNSASVYPEKLPDFAIQSNQIDAIQSIYTQMKNVRTVDVASLIMKAKDDYIYYKTDHHMTSLGAYLLYVGYCKEAGIDVKNLNEFTKKTVSINFLGTFDSKIQLLWQRPDTIVAYESKENTDLKEVEYDNVTTNSIFNDEYLNKKDKYSYFLNGNNSKVVIKTKVENGKKLLIIKDSYAHSVAQFLCSNYEEIHLIDPRYYHMSLSEYQKENGITSVLFLYNYSNLQTDFGLYSSQF